MERKKSIEAFNEALKYIPGGVNSPVRALKSVGETPLFITKANGVTLTDVDNNHFIDFCLSWGVFILGHSRPEVNSVILSAVGNGTSYGIPSLQETELAKMICSIYKSIDRVRFVNSGTEAVMSAIRLARGYTNRNVIVKFDGCYHGHVDHMLVSAGSGVVNLSESSSSGVPADFTKYTISIPFNDTLSVEKLFKERGNEIAAVIVEPVPANMGVVIPQVGFLNYLREITTQYGALLIFDEVITGFRLSKGGAQELFDITPDLTTLGKIVGGGFPAAAFGGRKEIMSMLAPDGPVYQAGTLSGNPIAMTAGIETVKILSDPEFYPKLLAKADTFYAELNEIVKDEDVQLNAVGAMFTLFFTKDKVSSFSDAKKTDQSAFASFFKYMLVHNIYVSPSQFEANFISVAHTDEELAYYLKVVRDYFKSDRL